MWLREDTHNMNIKANWLQIDKCAQAHYEKHQDEYLRMWGNRLSSIAKRYDLSESDDWHIHMGYDPVYQEYMSYITCGKELLAVIHMY